MLWRLVRPTRRRVCAGLGVLLLAVLGGYFYFTSDTRIRAIVEAELTEQLARPVRVGGASFSLFGPIEILDLELPSKDPARPSELTVEKITLHHEVLAMLRGDFQPTRVVCDGMVVTVEVDLAPVDPDAKPPPEAAQREPFKQPDFDLPTVMLRGGKLRLLYHDGARHVETVETSVSVELNPLSERKYDLSAAASLAGGGGFDLSGIVNTVRGDLDELSVPIEFVRRLLPPELRKQVGQYAASGSLNVTRRTAADVEAQPYYVVDLKGLAAVLPKSLIPIHVADLQGRIVVDTKGKRIELEDVSCVLPELGRQAKLVLSGGYYGFEDDSPCRLRGVLGRCELPAKLGVGQVEKTLAFIRKYYDPRGPLVVDVGYNRQSGKEGKLRGTVRMEGHGSARCAYFPYRLEQIIGRIDFTADRITLLHIEGTHGEGTAKVVGNVSDFDGYGLYDITISARDVAMDADLKYALDDSVGKFLWRDLQPRGWGNTVVRVSRASHKEDFRINVALDLDGRAGITHAAFPYALDKIRGKVVIDGKAVRITDATGVHGPAVCTVNGAVTKIDTSHPAVDLAVDVKNMPVDKALLTAVGPDGAEALRDLGAAGTVKSGRTRVTYGVDGKLDYHVRADLGKVRIKPDVFPYEMTDVVGQIVVTPRDVVLKELTGRHGKTDVTAEGKILLTGKVPAIERLSFTAKNLALDAELRSALGDEVREVWGDLALGGSVDVARGVLRHKNPGKPDAMDYTIEARLGNARARPKMFPYDLVDVAGDVTITPRYVALDRLTGRHGKSPITLDGRILLTAKDAAIKSLVFTAKGVALDDDLRVALGPELADIWRDLAPGGKVDIPRGMLSHKDQAKPDKLDYDITIEPLGASVTFVDFPRTVTGITGRIHAVGGLVTLAGLRAAEGKTKIELDGRILTGQNDGAELALTAWDVPVDKRLIAAMGKVAPDGIKHIKPGGTISVKLEKLSFGSLCPSDKGAATRKAPGAKAPGAKVPAPEVSRPWAATGIVSFKDMGVDVGLGSKTLSGSFVGSGSGRGEQLEMDAKLALDEVLVGTRQITALRGQLLKKRDGTMLQIRNFNAWSYGGQLDGKAEIDLGDPIKYGIDLVVHRIKLAEMAALGGLGPAAVKDAKKVKGMLSGRITMLAVNGDATKQQGSGKIHITDANISKLPILLELLHLVQLQLPGNTSFTEADVIYRLSGQKLIFQEIYLQSSVISFVGSGTLDLKSSKIRLTFVGGRVGKLPRLKKLIGLGPADIIKLLAKQIVEIRTTGTLEKPKTETIPLPGLPNFNKLLRVLLRPPPIEDDAP